MDRQTVLILALGLLAAAGFTVAISGFLLRGRLKRAVVGPDADATADTPPEADGKGGEGS